MHIFLSLPIEGIVGFDELTIRFPLRFAARFDSLCFVFFLLWSNISAGHDNVNGEPLPSFTTSCSGHHRSYLLAQVFLLPLLH